MNNSNKKLHTKHLALYVKSDQLNRECLMPQIVTKLFASYNVLTIRLTNYEKITHGKNKRHCSRLRNFLC